eukprot:TRINITY_DN64798_c0_g1_i1.p1 TRINITY_DN64798_c0_g1~~TRINITY_DN64798_c0_g1_i1.p1  ORF type:complete len:357 (+),score=75.76 TRINITY_DN64798_c0_g1_i1:79-1149(+)
MHFFGLFERVDTLFRLFLIRYVFFSFFYFFFTSCLNLFHWVPFIQSLSTWGRRWSMQWYHRLLFAWYCEKMFPLHHFLEQSELEYLSKCFRLSDRKTQSSPFGGDFLSYFSYSSLVSKGVVRRGRLAFGSLLHPMELWDDAQRVMRERNATLPQSMQENWAQFNDAWRFYGVGWDVASQPHEPIRGVFKVYFICRSVNELPKEFKQLLDTAEIPVKDVIPQCLFCCIYPLTQEKGVNTPPTEKKVYLFPEEFVSDGSENDPRKCREYPDELRNIPCIENCVNYAMMFSSSRGLCFQFDADESEWWNGRLSEVGKKEVEKWSSIGFKLDTIAWGNAETYVLYFPLIEGDVQTDGRKM